jgi:cytochrome P450
LDTADSRYLDSPYLKGKTLISSGEEIREILLSPSFVQPGTEGRPFYYDDVLASMDGDKHAKRRSIFGKLFGEPALQRYAAEMLTPSIDISFAELRGLADERGLVRTDLIPLTWRILFRVSGRIVGIDGSDDPAVVADLMKTITTLTEALGGEWALDTEKVKRNGALAEEQFRDRYFRPAYERRQKLVADFRAGRRAQTDLPNDFLTMLILNGGPDVDEGVMLRETIMAMAGATGSSVQSLPLFISQFEEWLAIHPDKRALIFEDREFLRKATHESLRFFNATPARVRIAAEDVTLKSGRFVKAGEQVAVLLFFANMSDDDFGADATRYDPFRAAGPTPWGLAFGFGMHSCLGRPLVTSSSRTDRDGTIAAVARRLYQAGLRLDEDRPAIFNDQSFKIVCTSLPIVLTDI